MSNTNIDRIIGYTELEFPNSCSDIEIAPNEWVVSDIFNASMDLLIENYDYLDKMSKIYDIPPNNQITSWLGNDSISGDKWHVSNDISGNVIGTLSSVNDIDFFSNDYIVLANNTTVQLLSTNNDNYVVIDNVDETGVDQKFGEIPAIGVDSKDRIIVMDSDNLRIATLKYDSSFTSQGRCQSWETIKIWGQFGDSESDYGFSSMIDLVVENDFVYVLDNINSVIKKYNSDGFYQNTIRNDILTNGISLAVSNDEDIFVLTNTDVKKLDINGNIVDTFNYESFGQVPKRIRMSYDYNFVYVILEDSISKVTVDGKLAGIFSGEGDKNYSSGYSRDNGELYVTNEISVLKFNDALVFVSYKEDMSDYLWNNESLHIKKDEFVDAWVYNRCFHRFFDNLEIFRRSLYGRPKLVKTQVNANDGSILTSLKSISIRPFISTELEPFEYQKNDIYIGVNELVTPDVINRCLNQLCVLEERLLSLLEDELPDDELPTLPIVGAVNKVFEDYTNMVSENLIDNRVLE